MAPVRTLLLLDLGYAVTATAKALGTYRRETARIGKRYLAGALEHALRDDPVPWYFCRRRCRIRTADLRLLGKPTHPLLLGPIVDPRQDSSSQGTVERPVHHPALQREGLRTQKQPLRMRLHASWFDAAFGPHVNRTRIV